MASSLRPRSDIPKHRACQAFWAVRWLTQSRQVISIIHTWQRRVAEHLLLRHGWVLPEGQLIDQRCNDGAGVGTHPEHPLVMPAVGRQGGPEGPCRINAAHQDQYRSVLSRDCLIVSAGCLIEPKGSWLLQFLSLKRRGHSWLKRALDMHFSGLNDDNMLMLTRINTLRVCVG